MAGMQEQGKACIVGLVFSFGFFVQSSTLLHSVLTHLLRMTSFIWELENKNRTEAMKHSELPFAKKNFWLRRNGAIFVPHELYVHSLHGAKSRRF